MTTQEENSQVRLILRNFLKHQKARFTFPDVGMIKLEGKNGCGKSSILHAICFALYGTKPEGGVVTQSSKDSNPCATVKLEYLEMVITRKSNPRHLTMSFMDKKYEGDEAQNIIEINMGMNGEMFNLTSFISQERQWSVLRMTPAQRLKFFETISGGNNSTELMSKTRAIVSTVKEELTSLTIKLQSIEKVLSKKRKELDGVPKLELDIEDERNKYALLKHELRSLEKESIRLKNVSKTEASVGHARKRLKELLSIEDDPGDNVDELRKQIGVLELQQQEYETLKRYEALAEDHLKHLASEVEKLAEHLSKENERDIANAIKRLSALVEKNSHNVVRNKDLRERKTVAKKKIKELEKDLLSMLDPAKSDLDTKAAKQLESSKPSLKSIPFLIELFQKQLSIVLERIRKLREENECAKFNCPQCNALLSFNEKEVTVIETGVHVEISEEVNRAFKALEHRKYNLEDNVRFLQKVHEISSVELAIVDEPFADVDESLPLELKKAEDRMAAISTTRTLLKSKEEALMNKQLPASIANALKNHKDSTPIDKKLLQTLKAKLTDALAQQSNVQQREAEINHLKRFLKDAPPQSQTEESRTLEQVTEQLKQVERALSREEEFKEFVLREERRVQLEAEVVKLTDKVSRLTAEHEKMEGRLAGGVGLEESIKEAKVKAMQIVLDSVNTSASHYLSKLLDDDVSISVEGWVTTQKGVEKPSMNIVARRGDVVRKNAFGLGGGICQRCELAFLLAVNDISKGRLLLLDECFCWVDQDSHMEMMHRLKELCSDRLVIVVSHEANSGEFDHVVEV